MSEKSKSLIYQLLENAQAVYDTAKKPFIISKIKRGIDSAIESAKETIIDNELEISNIRKSMIENPKEIAGYLNDIIMAKQHCLNATRTIELLEGEKKELFN